jgi:DNA-binding NarL/FixJ family response regulator
MLTKTKPRGVVSLTEREQQVLNHIWDGLKNREIGKKLRISHKTVEAHRSSMMKKLQTTNSAQLLKSCCELGFLTAPGYVG